MSLGPVLWSVFGLERKSGLSDKGNLVTFDTLSEGELSVGLFCRFELNDESETVWYLLDVFLVYVVMVVVEVFGQRLYDVIPAAQD